MNGLYVIQYEDQEKGKAMMNICKHLSFALNSLIKSCKFKGIKKPKIKRMTEYQKVAVVNL